MTITTTSDNEKTCRFTGSLRKDSNKLKLFLNFTQEHAKRLMLNENRHVEITRKEDTFKLKFLQRKTARSILVSMSSSGGASMAIDPTRFKIDFNEPTDTCTFFAEYLDDQNGLRFDFNLEMFSKPREEQRPLTPITNAAEKTEFGFEPNSDWGVKLEATVSKEIKAKMKKYMQAKYIMDDIDEAHDDNT